MPSGVYKRNKPAWNKGKKGLWKHTEESRKKLRGRTPWNKGGTHSPEAREKISKALKNNPGITGENNYLWKGGYENTIRYNRERLQLIKRNGGRHTLGEWETLKAQYNWTCPCCKKSEPEIKLQRDHIIPVTKGGSNNIENIQPLCQKCNAYKWTKTVKY